MKREIQVTADGSVTIHLPEWDESYHSKHGAIQEARHVFLQHGFHARKENPIHILEIGFGTGLNAFLTFLEAQAARRSVFYTGVEAYPIASDEIAKLNYAEAAGAPNAVSILKRLHDTAWEQETAISDGFTLCKRRQFFDAIADVGQFDLIYFDAFGYRVQPELWSEAIFNRMFTALKPGGLLVTYAARSIIKRNMQAAGFTVEKCPGPPGKREMMRAHKPV